MTESGIGTRSMATPAASETDGEAARGWYLYGVTRRGPLAAALAEADGGDPADAGPGEATSAPAPLQLLEFSELAAVVRPVLLADFSLAVLQERLRSASALESMVRGHNRVIEAIHRQQAILPAKFGSVYARAGDVVSALRPVRESFLRQLERLEGCDEWAVHLYADPAAVREQISTGDPEIRRLREEHAAARPGRAYFLERQLRDELESATQQTLMTLGQNAFDRLAGRAVAAEVSPIGPGTDPAGEAEILRASFLVARDGSERFEEALHACADASEGLRCECSGPWPPYSFAFPDDEEAE